eukprot:6463992-Amphidinium_carterae.3
MAEALERLAAVEQQVQALAGLLDQSRGREDALQAEVRRLQQNEQTRTVGGGSHGPGTVDTRSLGKPDTFTGEERKFHDWKTLVKAYCSCLSH